MRRLTKKQTEFAIALVETGNASEAYRRAYNTSRMKPSSVRYMARDLLNKAQVMALVNELRHEEEERLKRKYKVKNDRAFEQYIRLAFSDIRRLFTENGNLKAVDELDDDIAAAIASIEVVTNVIGRGQEKRVEYVHKIKLLDKRQPLQDIAKMLGMFENDNKQRNTKQESPLERVTESLIDRLGRLYPDPLQSFEGQQQQS